jgi:hypothetical protein
MAAIKAYTDIEQSKKLAEILPIESADMRYGYIAPYEYSDRMFDGGYDEVPYLKDFLKKNPNFSEDEYDGELPCWSLAALLNLLPSEFTEKGEYSETTYNIKIRKYALTKDVDIHQIAYGSIKFDVDGQYSFKDMINTGEKEDLLDAVFQMICWLKENGKI